jgi:hypothetical protein
VTDGVGVVGVVPAERIQQIQDFLVDIGCNIVVDCVRMWVWNSSGRTEIFGESRGLHRRVC